MPLIAGVFARFDAQPPDPYTDDGSQYDDRGCKRNKRKDTDDKRDCYGDRSHNDDQHVG